MQTKITLLLLGSLLPAIASSSPVMEATIGKSYTNWDW